MLGVRENEGRGRAGATARVLRVGEGLGGAVVGVGLLEGRAQADAVLRGAELRGGGQPEQVHERRVAATQLLCESAGSGFYRARVALWCAAVVQDCTTHGRGNSL